MRKGRGGLGEAAKCIYGSGDAPEVEHFFSLAVRIESTRNLKALASTPLFHPQVGAQSALGSIGNDKLCREKSGLEVFLSSLIKKKKSHQKK